MGMTCKRYLGVDMVVDITMGSEVSHLVDEQVMGAFGSIWKGLVSLRAKMVTYEGIVY